MWQPCKTTVRTLGGCRLVAATRVQDSRYLCDSSIPYPHSSAASRGQGARAFSLDAGADVLDMADLVREFHVLKPPWSRRQAVHFQEELASSRQTVGVTYRRRCLVRVEIHLLLIPLIAWDSPS
jgi:hypothetical protein